MPKSFDIIGPKKRSTYSLKPVSNSEHSSKYGHSQPSKTKSSLGSYVGLSILAIGLAFGFVYLFHSNPTLKLPSWFKFAEDTSQIGIKTGGELTSAPIQKTQIKIKILNASDNPGAANTVTDQLEAVGFKITESGEAQNRLNQTIIYYKEGGHAAAEAIAAAIPGQQVLEQTEKIDSGIDIIVAVGS